MVEYDMNVFRNNEVFILIGAAKIEASRKIV